MKLGMRATVASKAYVEYELSLYRDVHQESITRII